MSDVFEVYNHIRSEAFRMYVSRHLKFMSINFPIFGREMKAGDHVFYESALQSVIFGKLYADLMHIDEPDAWFVAVEQPLVGIRDIKRDISKADKPMRIDICVAGTQGEKHNIQVLMIEVKADFQSDSVEKDLVRIETAIHESKNRSINVFCGACFYAVEQLPTKQIAIQTSSPIVAVPVVVPVWTPGLAQRNASGTQMEEESPLAGRKRRNFLV